MSRGSPKALHQISMRYSPVEDRVLLIFTAGDGSTFRFWMTRRFVDLLWQGLIKVLASYPALKGLVDSRVREAVLSMRHAEAVQGSDFKTPLRGAGTPPADDPAAPLFTGVTGTPKPDGTTRFLFQTKEGEPFQCSLNEQLLHAFCHLLIDVTAKAGWDLELRVGDGNLVLPGPGAKIH
ncbi:MAG: hypothetical protein H7841_10245 [Magnetospirillum sp. WYHS-4]